MKKYAAYYRVSTDKQGEVGLGMESQKQIVRHFFNDGELVKEFLEVKSGKNISERPKLREAIDYCLKNDCILVVAKVDRLSRSVDDARAILEQLKGKIRFGDIPGEPDKFTLTLFAAFSERERELIGIRTKAALKVRLEQKGKWQLKAGEETIKGKIASPALHDRSAIIKSAKSRKLSALTNENNVRATQVIKTHLNNGKSIPDIINILNENKFKTSRNNNFSYAQVQRLATR